jgi:hypothetical protein
MKDFITFLFLFVLGFAAFIVVVTPVIVLLCKYLGWLVDKFDF